MSCSRHKKDIKLLLYMQQIIINEVATSYILMALHTLLEMLTRRLRIEFCFNFLSKLILSNVGMP